MITREQALAIARTYLGRMSTSSGIELSLLDANTREEDFGWVFFYNSKAFLDSGDYRHMLAGNAPIIIDRERGAIHETGTAEPIENYIDRFRKSRKLD